MPETHEAILEALRAAVKSEPPAGELPAVFDAFQVRFKSYTAGRSLACFVPADPRFATATGVLQSGVITAAFDIAFSCLALLEARRLVSPVTMEASFIRPIAADGHLFEVHARIKAKSRSAIFLDGRASTTNGKTAATAGATMAVLKAKPGGTADSGVDSGEGFDPETGEL